MDAALRDRVVEALWPPDSRAQGSVWAILDGARDERIYYALRNSRLDFLCLYSGQLHRELQLAAPYIVELAPNYRFTPQLIDMAWGNSWGVFVRIKDPSNLRHHLRRFLRVRDESGRILIFRYYDPRVLRVYLPTCRPDELATVFGPLDSYLVESEDGKSLIEFRFDGVALRERRIVLGAETSPA